MREFQCLFCEKLCKNKHSYNQHTIRCKDNPNRIDLSYMKTESYRETKRLNFLKLSKNNNSLETYWNSKFGKVVKKFEICQNVNCQKFFTYEEREFKESNLKFCCLSCANSHPRSKSYKDKLSAILQFSLKARLQRCSSEDKIWIENNIPLFKDNLKLLFKNYIERKTKLELNSLKLKTKKIVRDFQIGESLEKNIYKKLCTFTFSIKYYPQEFELDLIKKHGWYKAKNRGDNLGGVSRDHMFSKEQGFLNKINPQIISHPANCKLMPHPENFKKSIDCSITLEELLKRIEQWDSKYGYFYGQSINNIYTI